MKIKNKKLLLDIKEKKYLNINLGSGNENLKNYYNFDINNHDNTDVICDLNEKLILLPNDTVKRIYSNQTLEHLSNLEGFMQEVVRICIHNAEILFKVPHFANPYYYSDPTHERHFGLFSMHYFAKPKDQWKRKVPNYLTLSELSLIEVKILFYRDTIFEHLFNPLLERLVNINNSTKHFFEKRLCWLYPPSNVEYRLKINKDSTN